MSDRNSAVAYAVSAIIIATIIITAAVIYTPSLLSTSMQSQSSRSSQLGSGSGTLNIYLTDAPPSSPTLKYLLVNVSSIELRYEGNISTVTSTSTTSSGTTTSTSTATSSTSSQTGPENLYVFKVPASLGNNINLTSLHGNPLLLGATHLPSGQVTSIVINITGAKAFYTDLSSEQLKVVANGKLMVPIHFGIYDGGTTNLTVDITPNLVHISNAGILTPVIHVSTVEEGPNNSATSHTTEVEESTSVSSTSSTASSTTSQATS